jgi:hypothetical protein
MTGPTLPAEGGCRCGRVRFRVSAPPLITMACHCTGCQRMTASAFSLSAAIPSDGFAVTAGEPVLGGLQGEVQQYFCPSCMSWLFTRMPGMDQFVNVRATLLDDAGWFSPYIETYTSEALPWAKTPAVHSFEKFPDMTAYGPLIEEYRQSLE